MHLTKCTFCGNHTAFQNRVGEINHFILKDYTLLWNNFGFQHFAAHRSILLVKDDMTKNCCTTLSYKMNTKKVGLKLLL